MARTVAGRMVGRPQLDGTKRGDEAPARRCRGDEGAALVELGLAMPIIVGLVMATITSGLAINQKMQLVHATREGARYGATVPSSQTFANGGTYAENISAVLVSRAGGALDTPGWSVCVSLVEGSGAGGVYVVSGPFAPSTYTTNANGTPCDPNETYPTTLYDPGRRVQVRVTRPTSIETGFGSWKVNLSSNATAKSESGA
jgi:Flp pilus assembly protein TadG